MGVVMVQFRIQPPPLKGKEVSIMRGWIALQKCVHITKIDPSGSVNHGQQLVQRKPHATGGVTHGCAKVNVAIFHMAFIDGYLATMSAANCWAFFFFNSHRNNFPHTSHHSHI